MSKRSRSRSSSPSSPSSPGPSTPIPGPSKLPQLQDTADSAVEVMRCSLPPHRETFSFPSYADYEVHYRQAHVNRCAECGKNFPTERFLELHIEENHDPLTAAKRERGDKTVRVHPAEKQLIIKGRSRLLTLCLTSMAVLSKVANGSAQHPRNEDSI